jgi:hypothetical protein
MAVLFYFLPVFMALWPEFWLSTEHETLGRHKGRQDRKERKNPGVTLPPHPY